MADLRADLDGTGRRLSYWARLTEERFTNVDLVLVLGALAITSLVGALCGAFLVGQ